MSEKESQFKEVLDANYCWPCVFPFKFIIPAESLEEMLVIFPGEKYSSRLSQTGKYISVTIYKYVCSSEEVVQIYEKAGQINGVISL